MLKYSFFLVFFLLLGTLMAQNVTLSGQFLTPEGAAIGGVSLSLINGSGNTIATQTIDCSGTYNFTDIPAGNDYVLHAEKPQNPLNGTTTFDLVLMSKHILGVQALSDNYKIAAADVNTSGSITVLDLMLLRALVLARLENFPGGNWLFFSSPNTSASSDFPLDLSNDQTAVNFVGIKKGDVNGSANPCF